MCSSGVWCVWRARERVCTPPFGKGKYELFNQRDPAKKDVFHRIRAYTLLFSVFSFRHAKIFPSYHSIRVYSEVIAYAYT